MIALVFVILVTAVVLLVSGKVRPDIVGLLSMMALFLSGVIDTREALAGFSDNTVILIAVLFVVGEGISRSGIAAWLGNRIVQYAGSSRDRLLLLIMIGTAALLTFVSSSGAVAMMLPVVVAAAWGLKSLPPKFLLPVAIVANLAGALTLISAPTNIIVSDALADSGHQPFAVFELTIIGVPMVVMAVAYIVFVGKRLLPEYQPRERPADLQVSLGELSETYSLRGNIFWLNVLPGSDLAGQTLGQADITGAFGVSVLHREAQQPDVERRHRIERMCQALEGILQAETIPERRSLLSAAAEATEGSASSSPARPGYDLRGRRYTAGQRRPGRCAVLDSDAQTGHRADSRNGWFGGRSLVDA